MEVYDQEKAAQVWQRVRGSNSSPTPEPNTKGLLGLIAEELTDATTYLHLSRMFQGRQSAMLRKLFEEEQAHAACLKGIYTLTTGTRPATRTVPPSQENPEITLRRCYGREMRCLAEYESRSADSQYGQVFSRLAAQEREHLRMVLELIGNLKK